MVIGSNTVILTHAQKIKWKGGRHEKGTSKTFRDVKTTMDEMKNTPDDINRRFDIVKGKIWELAIVEEKINELEEFIAIEKTKWNIQRKYNF